jgi:hypothetical protein
MQHIKSYFNKIEKILSDRKFSSKKTKQSKGFVSTEKKIDQSISAKDPVELIADYIEGIREARDELMKAKK